MVDDALLELMTDEVTLRPPAALNGFGEPSFGAPVTVACRVQPEAQYETGVLTADGMVFLADVYPVNVDWQLVLPEGTLPPGRDAHLVRVEQYTDEVGPYCTVLYYGGR